MKKLILVRNTVESIYLDEHPVPSREVLPIKDNSNNSNYIEYSDLAPEQIRLLKNHVEMVNYNFNCSILIKVNGKYVGTYGKCGAWRFVFNYLGVDKVLTHNWGGYADIVKLNELWRGN